ncbi:MAG: hypothetical protein U0990_05010 [Candidatus Nanopelagicales bacterium]|nr:hypothetical protein [Candidatus Nanopelagicales bacterium]MDZ4249433.1 hypothetical protein [Candidatus Nanopelagicales bacterium]
MSSTSGFWVAPPSGKMTNTLVNTGVLPGRNYTYDNDQMVSAVQDAVPNPLN